MANSPLRKKITIEIVSKGRKYFKVCYPGKSEFQLIINEISKDFQPGQVVEDLLCEFEYKPNLYTGGGKTTAIPINDQIIAQREAEARELKRQEEINRWRGYVESALAEDRIYNRGLSELESLRFDISVYAARIAEIKEVQRQSEIKRWSGYCESAALEGRTYHNGLHKLTELGRSDLARQYQQQATEVRSQPKRQEVEGEEQQRKKEQEKEIADYWFCSPAWNSADELTHLEVGDLYKGKDGNWYKILTRRYQRVREDGMSFGLADDQGEIISGKARLATPEEAAPMIAAEEEAKAQREAKQARDAERKVLAEYIREHGDRPEHTVGECLLDTANIYGGGDWFEIDEAAGEIWYCQNNGADGDDWSRNNVSTWGAGAIGWRIPYDAAIANRIKLLNSE